jgi:hypothetical protein
MQLFSLSDAEKLVLVSKLANFLTRVEPLSCKLSEGSQFEGRKLELLVFDGR